MAWVKLACSMALTVFGCMALWQVAQLAKESRLTNTKLTQTLTDLNRTVIVAGVTMSEVQKGALEWQKASRTQAQQVTFAMAHISETATAFGSFARTVEKSSSATLDHASSLLDSQNNALLLNQAKLRSNLNALQSTTAALQRTISDADTLIASPSLSSSLASLSASSEGIQAGVTNLVGVTADAKAAADYELAQLRKPATVWLQVLKFVLSYGSDARVLFTGGVK